MPVNRNALIRYKTIDNCLQNRYRKWTINDLIDACSKALYEYEGIDKGISVRTIRVDLQTMRSDKLGYNAPIIVVDKKYYTYEDPEYSITNMPITENDLNQLSEVVAMLSQFKGFTHFQEMNGMVQRLEDKIQSSRSNTKSIVHLEKNDNLEGLQYIDPLYQAILTKTVQIITYQSFKAKQAREINFHPFLLKEFRNRWFVLGRKNAKEPLMTLALDRIKGVSPNTNEPFVENENFDPETHFKNVVGVTVNEGLRPQRVILFVDKRNAPYVITKPIHPSQKVISETNEGVELELTVIPNFELERVILGYGNHMVVKQPKKMRETIQKKLERSLKKYQQLNDELGKSKC